MKKYFLLINILFVANAFAAELSPCLEEVLHLQGYSPIENERQLECLTRIPELLATQAILCADKNQSVSETFLNYKAHQEKYKIANQEYKDALTSGSSQVRAKKAQRDVALSIWQIQGSKMQIESALREITFPILGICHISKF